MDGGGPVSIGAHFKGTDNTLLADLVLWPITHLDDDSAFLTHFDSAFPLQDRFWQRASPPPGQLSNVELIHGLRTLHLQPIANYCWALPPGRELYTLGSKGQQVGSQTVKKALRASHDTSLCAGRIP
jgi:hypothetical protein